MTTTTTTTAKNRRTRGQTLILGAVSMLFLALMMMASYSIGNALHQKVALQSQADAASYSVAVAEARTMNVVAYFNRAIVGTLVANASLHAWMAIATADVSQLWDGVNLFGEINAFEISEGCRMIAPWVPHPMAWLHCPHLVEAEWDGLMFFLDALSWDDNLSGIDGAFNDGVDAITRANKTIYNVANTSVGLGALQTLGTAGPIDVLSEIQKNAPGATKSSVLLPLNEQQYACAFEGLKIDSCKNLGLPGINPYRAAASLDDRSRVLRSAANADRPIFTNGSLASDAITMGITRQFTGDFDHNAKEANDQLTSGSWDIMTYPMVKGEIGESHPNFINQYFGAYPIMGKFGGNDKADDISGGAGAGTAWIKNWGWLKPSHGHAPWNPLPFGGGIYSDQGGGGHMMENWWFALGDIVPFDSNHDKYRGMVDVCQNGALTSCFINYRGQTDIKKNLGQPLVFAGYTQNLRNYDAKTGDKEDRKMATATPPWELNKDGKVNVKFVKNQTATVNYVARGEGHAVSKSMVYFHQLADWSVPPNFFDPFWRAKLHFFTRAELEEVLLLTGDGMVGAVGPYDGDY